MTRSSDGNDERESSPALDSTNTATMISAKEIHYGIESFYAIVKPVFITMVLAALAVIFITTEEFAAAQSQGLADAYTVRQSDESASNGKKLSDSFINGIIIVSAIGAMTFLIVLLYKYRCMKILVGFMLFQSLLLLGFLAGIMFQVAINRYRLKIDVFSFAFFLWNFALVGTSSIFYGRGFPPYVTQGYLIVTSVIVAWQLSFFDDWTAWVLLVLLALYDLFAVLSPCGPLKALVKLMQRENAPEMPGLLYEAQLPRTAQRRRNGNNDSDTNNQNESNNTESDSAPPAVVDQDAGHTRPNRSNAHAASVEQANNQSVNPENTHTGAADKAQSNSSNVTLEPGHSPATENSEQTHEADQATATQPSSNAPDTDVPLPAVNTDIEIESEQMRVPTPPTARVPLALAKVYKLPLLNNPAPSWLQVNDETSYSPDQLQALIEVVFPINGGRILEQPCHRSSDREDRETRYQVIDKDGLIRRVLFVNEEGRVFEDRGEEPQEDSDNDNSIKLGLGDFIFYSILVSKAAAYSFTAFSVCSLAIVTGLGLTLLLLAVYGQALPALPISIFLGVLFFLITVYAIEPWVHAIFEEQLYV